MTWTWAEDLPKEVKDKVTGQAWRKEACPKCGKALGPVTLRRPHQVLDCAGCAALLLIEPVRYAREVR